MGRISLDSEWRFAFTVSASEDGHFKENGYYPMRFTANGGTEINMQLIKKVYSADKRNVLLVFRTNMLPEGFVFSRCQSVRVALERVTGLYVPKSAMTINRSRSGVYVLRGSVVAYRSVEIIYEGPDYYLVTDGKGPDEKKVYLSRNEQIITKGKNLFDGRIIGD